MYKQMIISKVLLRFKRVFSLGEYRIQRVLDIVRLGGETHSGSSYSQISACYLHHGDHAGGEIALETERRLSSSSCSGAASGWSRGPRGPMELQFPSRRSITDQQRGFQVPRFKPL
jgi:hypothetical protein